MKIIRASLFIFLGFIVGCSDDGDSPTDPGGGNGGGTPSLSVNNISTIENGNAVFTVSTSATSSDAIMFNYASSDGTATSGQGNDFTSVSGTGTITAGASSTTITVTVNDDATLENREIFTLTISQPVNADITDGSGTATIWDNDGVSFASDIRPIIQANGCLSASCHGGNNSQGGMTLGSATYTQVRTASGDHGAIVVPRDANSSNFFLKVSPDPPFGERMPRNRAPLTTTQINNIRDWINQDAQDN